MARAALGQTHDLASLPYLDEEVLLAEIKHRYSDDQIYSYVGDILVAVNPFRDLGIYGKKYTDQYKQSKRNDNPPHIYAVSDLSYQFMLSGTAVGGKKNQCIVISGESGAGKTESTKLIIKQLIELCKGKSQLEQQILQVNPLLEAFGNAQTVMNDNSSRFGKYIQLKFKEGTVMGAKISEYLLEKSRVVFQNPGEENFHIFYYMLAGLDEEMKKKLQLENASDYMYLRNGPSCLKNNPAGLKKYFDELINAMDLVGFLEEEKEDMFHILASVLALGQLKIEANEEDAAYITNPEAAQKVGDLLGIAKEDLMSNLTYTTSVAHGERFQRNYTKSQAQDARDAMTKALYGRLFSWIVNKINQLLAPEEQLDPSQATEIGILDIFGFEHLQTNSFEQACINLANEQLQYFFNQHIFLLEQDEYQREGIDWSNIPFVNNEPLLGLFLTKPIGILALVDEETLFPKGNDHSLVEKMNKHFARNHHYIKAKISTSNTFSVDHYAGRVSYDATGFLDKNRDTLPNAVTTMLQNSSNDLLARVFRGTITRTGTLALQNRMSKKRSRKSLKKRGAPKATVKKITVGAQFKTSLAILMELLNMSNPHFVRCVKPNTSKSARNFDDKYITAQLRYTGMLETTKIRRLGYAIRPQFVDFVKRYKVLALSPKLATDKRGCVKILETIGLKDWKVGKTKVFLKYYHQDMLEEKMRKMGESAVHLTRLVRGFLARRLFRRLQEKAAKEKAESEAFLAKLEALSLKQSNNMMDMLQKDKMIPHEFVEKLHNATGVVTFDANAPVVQESEPVVQEEKAASPDEDDEDDDDDDDEDDDVIEDEFVKHSHYKFGRVGTKSASIMWFKETQSMKLKKDGGTFYPWFHGIITRRQAEELLLPKPVGSYLLRVSESRFGYSLSLRGADRCKHFMIDQLHNGKYVVVGEPQVHKTLNDLIKFHSLKKNPISPFGDLLIEACGQEEGECDYSDLVDRDDDKRSSTSSTSSMPSRYIPSPSDVGYLTPDPQPTQKQHSPSLQRRLTSGPRSVSPSPSKAVRGAKGSTQRPVSAASYLSVTDDTNARNKPQLPERGVAHTFRRSAFRQKSPSRPPSSQF
ncbi:myosin-IIIb-like isoform X1 [Lytechinus pictus]|uniref:myosin-IIIb-like isoform X1 n=1 Tax=Lytechinus pictus TaxID=7653 RepID=UPI0030BA176F